MFNNVSPEDEKLKQDKLKDAFIPPGMFLGGPQKDYIFGNALYHNLGGGKFAEVSDSMGTENYCRGDRAWETYFQTFAGRHMSRSLAGSTDLYVESEGFAKVRR